MRAVLALIAAAAFLVGCGRSTEFTPDQQAAITAVCTQAGGYIYDISTYRDVPYIIACKARNPSNQEKPK